MPDSRHALSSAEELILRAGQGDQDAFGTLVEREQAAVFRFIRTLGLEGADAEDALQDSFLGAWRGASTYRGAGSARSWLFSVARNVVRHHRRRRAAERVVVASVDELPEAEVLEGLALRAGWGSPAVDDADVDRAQLVAAALERLSHDDREILLLRDIEQLPGEDVARTLGLTLAAMKSRLHRARLRLAVHVRELADDAT